MKKRTIYLDYAATGPLLPEAKAAILAALEAGYGNASALHSTGYAAKVAIEDARAAIAQLIHAEPEEIIFTSGGSEANNTVAEIFRGERVAVSAVEHPSILKAVQARAKAMSVIDVDQWGFVQLTAIEQIVAQKPALVSVMLANNELGSIEPVQAIVKCCKKYNIPVHTDATQAFGKIHLNVKELDVDYMTLSAHKCGGPLGVGALYVRQGAKFTPFIYGGHQEGRRRAGTQNVPGIIGFGTAAKWCYDHWSCKLYAEQVQPLRDELRRRILAEIPYSSCNSPEKECLPNILNMSFEAAEGESIQLYLDAEGIMVSTGSACAAGDTTPSHVLMAVSGDAEKAHSSVRFSLGLETQPQDIERVMEVLPGIIKRLQGISTVKPKGVK